MDAETQHAFLDLAKAHHFEQCIEMLQEKKELANCQPSGRWPVLHQAALSGDVNAAKSLLELRCDPLAKNRDGKLAAEITKSAAIRVLLAGTSCVGDDAEDEANEASEHESEEENDEDSCDHDWSEFEDDDVDFERDEKKRLRVAMAPTSAVVAWGSKDGVGPLGDSGLQASASTLERLCLVCNGGTAAMLSSCVPSIPESVAVAMTHNLQILRIDAFPGCGDPVFGTHLEAKRCQKAEPYDLFAHLASAFRGGKQCKLRKLTLQYGYHSASSLIDFLFAARPPLESFRCRETLFHGRNFAPIVLAMKKALPHPEKLVEFETDAYIAAEDPFGMLADAFPGLRFLRVARLYSKAPRVVALKRFKHLNMCKCKFSKDNRKLRGNFAIKGSYVHWFITSDHHDDGYRGQGLWWDNLENTCECMESWAVGQGVNREMVLDFMAECGIDLDESLDEDDCGASDTDFDADDSGEVPSIVVQLTKTDAGGGDFVVKVTNVGGEEVASEKLQSDTSLRTLLETIASRCKCGILSLQPIFPDGTTVNPAKDGGKSVPSFFPYITHESPNMTSQGLGV
eukprot:TRINITY_DN21788_c0_g1_i1.p1 TRINITY_DN21788_c0_g1~~TRINITY_DN21788_c0_g1_i1.p1  ORF type:complete len:586 (+),score=85.77 TRINITY_DN21788_c0_g1_i1:54-1760(+)